MITRLILASVLALTSAAPIFGSILTYTDPATMELAQPALAFSSITFDGFAGGYNTSAGLTIAATNFVGVTVTTPPPYDLAVGSSVASWGGGSTLVNNNPSPSGRLIVTLPPNVFAVGADLLAIYSTGLGGPNGNGFQVAIYNGSTSNFTTSPASALPSSLFFGATSTTPIQSVTFMVPAGTFGIQLGMDNFEIGTQAETPEVATLLAIGTGLIAMRWMRRRRPMKLA